MTRDTNRPPRVLLPGALEAGLVVAAALSLRLAARAPALARALGWSADRGEDALFFAGLFGAFAALGLLAFRLASAYARRARRIERSLAQAGGDRGQATVEFCLVFPLFAFLAAAVFQLALLAHAALVVRYAAFAAARAAIVRTEGPGAEALPAAQLSDVRRAARIVTATISPAGQTATTDKAVGAIRQILKQQKGLWGDKAFSRRYTYAVKATKVNAKVLPSPLTFWTPFQIVETAPVPTAPKQVSVTVRYDFYANMPGIVWLAGLSKKTPPGTGVSGYVFPIEKTVVLQGTGARASVFPMAAPGTSISP